MAVADIVVVGNIVGVAFDTVFVELAVEVAGEFELPSQMLKFVLGYCSSVAVVVLPM